MTAETMMTPATTKHSEPTSAATCHSDIQMLLKLVDGRTDNRNLDLNMLNHLIEMLTSPLGDNARTGRLFEEIFPVGLVDSFLMHDPDATSSGPQIKALSGFWTDDDGKSVIEKLSPDRHDLYTARARAAYIRLWIIPSAWLNLRGFLRHIRNTNRYPDPSTQLKLDRALGVLDGNDYWKHAMAGFYTKSRD